MAALSSGVASTPTVLAGWFKRLYANGVLDLVPDDMQFQKSVKFKQDKKIGDSYHQPVILSYEQGVTRGGTAGDAFELNTAAAGDTGNAYVTSSELTFRGFISKATMERSSTSEAAFGKGMDMKVKSMTASHSKALELDLLFGQDLVNGIGIVESISGSSTTRAIVLTPGSWSGLWIGSKGMKIDACDTGTSTVLNTSTVTIVSVNIATRTLNVSGTDGAAGLNEFDAGTVIHARAASTKACFGLGAIAGVTSGNLFGLSSDNDVWKPSAYNVAGALNFPKVLDLMQQAWERGLEGKAQFMLSGKAFGKLNLNESALRKYDMSYKKSKAENGVERISFIGHFGEVELLPHRYCKEGDGFVYRPEDLCRVGAYDGFKFDDGTPSDQVFTRLESYNGYEIRSYSDQALFSNKPAQIVRVYGITY